LSTVVLITYFVMLKKYTDWASRFNSFPEVYLTRGWVQIGQRGWGVSLYPIP